MIPATELRIGNIHESADFAIPRMGISSVKIDGKSFSMITSEGIRMVEECKLDFIPIKLTDEWMREFGFSTDTNSYSTYPTSSDPLKKCYEWYVCENMILSSHPDSGIELCAKIMCYYDFEIKTVVSIKYVHQLQNLYFALTGKELET